MARLWQNGLELNSTGANIEFTGPIGTGGSISSTFKHGGSYSYAITSLASGTAKGHYYQYLSAEGTGHYYFRFYLYITISPSAENRIVIWNDASNQSTPSIYITLDGSNQLRLYDEDGQIGSQSSALTASTWYRVELEYDTTQSAGSMIVTARIDGSNFASSTTRSIASNNQPFYWQVGGNLASEAQTSGGWYFDDMAINDTTGSYQTSWPGEGWIAHLKPDGTGDNGDWTGTYADIDEETPDGNASYIYSNTVNQLEDVNCAATASHLDSNATINVVAVGVNFAGASTTAVASFKVRIKDNTGATVSESAALTPNSTGYRNNSVANPANYPLVTYVRPGSTAWTKAYLDTAQVGVNCSTGNTNAARVTSLWISIDYVPTSSITGTLAKTLDGITVDLDGQLKIVGTASKTLDGIAASLTGSIKIVATLTKALDGIALYAIGSSAVSSEGSLDKTLDSITASLAGALKVKGALDKALDGISIDSDGLLAIKAILSKTLEGIALEADGRNKAIGSLGKTLDNITPTLTGKLAINANLSKTLEDATLDAAGVSTISTSGSLIKTLGDVTPVATGQLLIEGQLYKTLETISISADGGIAIEGQLDKTLDGVALTAYGEHGEIIEGSLIRTLDNITATANGKLLIRGGLVKTLDGVVISADGISAYSGTAEITLEGVAANIRGTIAIVAVAIIALDGIGLSARGNRPAQSPGGRTVLYVDERRDMEVGERATLYVNARKELEI